MVDDGAGRTGQIHLWISPIVPNLLVAWSERCTSHNVCPCKSRPVEREEEHDETHQQVSDPRLRHRHLRHRRTTVRADDRDQANRYIVTKLTSDISGAANTDPVLQNTWGVAFTPGASPF